MPFEIIDDKALWDKFVDNSPCGMIFHRWDFLQILEKNGAGKLLPFGIFKDSELISIIPLFLKTESGLKLLYSPPQSSLSNIPYLGFVMNSTFFNQKTYDRTVQLNYISCELNKALEQISPNYVDIGLVPAFNDIRPFGWNDFKPNLNFTYYIDLKVPIDTMWKNFDRECRRNISDCSKKQLSIIESYDVDKFFKIMVNGLKIGESNFFRRQKPQYLKDLLKTFPDNIKMFFLNDENGILGVKVNIGYKKRYVAWMGAVSVNGSSDVNEFLIWELMQKAKLDGYETYENIGADEKRLNPFKSKFNPVIVPYFNVGKSDFLYRAAKFGTRMINKIGK